MSYPASEKLEIIRTVETSPLRVRRTLARIGIPKSTFYAWLDRHAAGGLDGLEDRKPRPRRVWNRIRDEVRQRVMALALEQPELSDVYYGHADKILNTRREIKRKIIEQRRKMHFASAA